MNYEQYKIAMFLYLLSQRIPEDTNYIYTVDSNNEATLVLYYGDSTKLRVPTIIDGYPVRHIACTCYNYNTQIETVIIPEGIVSIG